LNKSQSNYGDFLGFSVKALLHGQTWHFLN
jgi:hypothetical protein